MMAKSTQVFKFSLEDRVRILSKGGKEGVVKEQHNDAEDGHMLGVETISVHGHLGTCFYPPDSLEDANLELHP